MTGPLRVWAKGVGLGLRTLPHAPALGVKRLLLPVSYWRTAEFGYVWRRLACPPGARILDLGSPKDLAHHLARDRGYRVVSVDILPSEVETSRRYPPPGNSAGAGSGSVQAEMQDGRRLSYGDHTFDAAYSVSVLEHIPDRGDSAAIRELVRVVKPGGVVVVTVPYDREYRETFVREAVYERRSEDGRPVFFERHYDALRLAGRLLEPSGARVSDVELWGEGGVRVERALDALGPLRALVSPAEALLAAAFLRRVRPGGAGHPMAAFVTLRTPRP